MDIPDQIQGEGEKEGLEGAENEYGYGGEWFLFFSFFFLSNNLNQGGYGEGIIVPDIEYSYSSSLEASTGDDDAKPTFTPPPVVTIPSINQTISPTSTPTSKQSNGFIVVSETLSPSIVPLVYNSSSDSSISIFTYFIYAFGFVVIIAVLFTFFCRYVLHLFSSLSSPLFHISFFLILVQRVMKLYIQEFIPQQKMKRMRKHTVVVVILNLQKDNKVFFFFFSLFQYSSSFSLLVLYY